MSTANKKIGVITATIVGMNAMIGSGIFTAPAALANQVGPAGILLYIFIVPAVWLVALSIARLAQLYPDEGSFYTYTKQWGGHTLGMVAIGAYFVGLLIAMGLLSQVAGVYLNTFITTISAYHLGLIILSALVLLNMFGVALSQLGQHILIVCTVFPLIATTIICALHANFDYLTPFAPHGYTSLLSATKIVIFGFFGFECATSLFNIVKEPQKNVPKALTYSILIVGAIYSCFVFSLMLCIPTNLFHGALTPLTTTLAQVFPNHPWLMFTIGISMLSAVVGTIHSMIWSSSHLLALIFKKIKHRRIQKLFNTSSLQEKWPVLIVGLLIFCSYIGLKNPDLFFSLTAIGIESAYILSMITLLTLKNEWKSGNNITTIIAIATALFILGCAMHNFVTEIYALL